MFVPFYKFAKLTKFVNGIYIKLSFPIIRERSSRPAAYLKNNKSLLFFQISEILSRFERKGFKLVAIKVVVPSKDFAKKHYHDLSERPFFNGLCDFLSSGPVVAMVRSAQIPYFIYPQLLKTISNEYLYTPSGLGRWGSDQVWP